MVSPSVTTTQYILQPGLLDKHRKTLEWLSATLLWKRELAFFQKVLDQYAPKYISADDKKKVDHFQNLIIYYNGEAIDVLRKKLREHESHLAYALESKNELDIQYFATHDLLMKELESFNSRLIEYKEEFFAFVEQAMQ